MPLRLLGGSGRREAAAETEAHSSPNDINIGVKVVYTPPADIQTTADIVAVHGITGDAFRTWTTQSKQGPDGGVFWLRDLLPAEVPNARILTYGYDSDPMRYFGSASTNMVLHHATTLVSELHYFRRKPNERQRPIIFVCHSLGGIVVKRALIYSSTCNRSHNPELRSIRVSTHGIIFLGTPHMGADPARWGLMAEKLVRLVAPSAAIDTNDSLIRTLGKNSETLQNITDSFVGLSAEFKMFFFFEELKTAIPGMSRDLIVEYASAVPEALPNAGRAAIHATHSDMCKFADATARGWNVLAGALCQWVEDAPHAVSVKWHQLLQQERLASDWEISGLLRGRRTPSPHTGIVDRESGGYSERDRQLHLTGADESLDPDTLAGPKLLTAAPPFIKPPALQENKFFVGRESELGLIHKIFTKPTKRTVLLSSIAGGGKSHLAREYFFTHREDFPGGVFWIDCHSPATGMFCAGMMESSYRSIAEQLHLVPPAPADDMVEPCIRKVIAWFTNNSDWLLVLDGVDIDSDSQYNTVARYLPPTASGSILFTSINAGLGRSARLGSPHLLVLDPPSLDEAVKMLAHYSNIPNTAPSAAYTDLCRALTCNPLAIHAAASYIKEKQLPVAEYLRKHQRQPFVERHYLRPFHVVFERLEPTYPQAAGLIKVLSFWGQGQGGGVPVPMLLWGIKSLERHERKALLAREGIRRGVDVDVSIGHCLRFSIIERALEAGPLEGELEADTLRLHPVAKEVCMVRMKEAKELGKWCDLAIEVFCNSFENLEARRGKEFSFEDGKKVDTVEFLISDYARYLTHGTHVSDCIRRYKLDPSDRLAQILSRIQQLAHPETTEETTKERISMLIRASTDGGSSVNETDTPGEDIEMWIAPANPLISAPEPPIDHEGQTGEKQHLGSSPQQRPFEFLYPPPTGPRVPVYTNRGGARGRRGRSSTANLESSSWPSPNRRWTAVRSPGGATGTAPSPWRDRQRSPNPGAFAPPAFNPLAHYDAYAGRGAGPYIPNYTSSHGYTQNHTSLAAAHSSPALSSPFVFTTSPPFTPMPPYPITPTNEVESISARPFTPGFRLPRDVSRSPVLGPVSGVYMRRPPLEVRSEPTSRASPIMGGVSLASSSPIPLANTQPVNCLGIDYAGGVSLPNSGTYLSPRHNPQSINSWRRVSVPPNQHLDGGSDMCRSRSEPAASQAATAIMHELWNDPRFYR